MTFASHFTEHALPKLRRHCRVAAVLHATADDDGLSFGPAFDFVRAEAVRLGAKHLPMELQRTLRSGLERLLLEEMEEALERVAAYAESVAGVWEETCAWNARVIEWAEGVERERSDAE